MADSIRRKLEPGEIKGFIQERPEKVPITADSSQMKTIRDIGGRFMPKSHSSTKLVTRLKTAYSTGTLSLVVGAGVSIEHGIPSWNELVLETMISALTSANRNASIVREFSTLYISLFLDNPVIAARHIAALTKEMTSRPDFVSALREALYSRESFKTESVFYRSLANLCASSRTTKSIESVVTYNFDDLLETYLDQLTVRIPYETICGPHLSRTDSNSLPIYHVHGFLPRGSRAMSAAVPILDENEYHRVYSNHFSWSNLVQLQTFSEATCAFIGLSMNDPNLRRLLDASMSLKKRRSRDRHVVFLKEHNLLDLERNAKNLLTGKSIAELNRLAMESTECLQSLLCVYEHAKRLELRSLGCDAVFVKDFRELPMILDRIRA